MNHPRPSTPSRRALLGGVVTGAGALAVPGIARAETTRFKDVHPSHPFYDEIHWCRDRGILEGWADNTYRPDQPILRDAFCAMLYRIAGRPGFATPTRAPFKDAPLSLVFVREIAWAQSRGIVKGWDDGTFRPFNRVLRGEVAAMITRLGFGTEVSPRTGRPFRDVPTGYVFVNQVHWVKMNDYLRGWSDGTYRTQNPLTRAEAAALFYRIAHRRETGLVHRTAGWSLDRSGKTPFTRAMDRPRLLDYQAVDSNGVVISTYGGKRVIHPVSTAWYSLYQMRSYEMTGNHEYLRRVRASVDHLVRNGSHLVDGARWYRYPFAHTPGGLDMGVPWYSGMAQGMMISVHVRLHQLTGEAAHRTYAQEALRSFDRVVSFYKDATGPWATAERDLDGKRSTFFEEYPSKRANQRSTVVNGHIYALYGLYDAYRLFGSGRSLTLFRRGTASIRDAFDFYRRPGKPSMYAITPWGHTTWGAPTSYHRGVTAQLRMLHELTGDYVFKRQADTLFSDSYLA